MTRRANDPIVLTPRQKQIMSLCAKGYTYEKIAEELKISEETVQSHLKIVRLRLNANNTMKAVSIAMTAGLIAC